MTADVADSAFGGAVYLTCLQHILRIYTQSRNKEKNTSAGCENELHFASNYAIYVSY